MKAKTRNFTQGINFSDIMTNSGTQGQLVGPNQIREHNTRGNFFHLTGSNTSAERALVLCNAGAKKARVHCNALSPDQGEH